MAIRTTLLDLVEAVSEFSDNEAEVVAQMNCAELFWLQHLKTTQH